MDIDIPSVELNNQEQTHIMEVDNHEQSNDMDVEQEAMVSICPGDSSKTFELPISAIKKLGTINDMIDNLGIPEVVIPLPFNLLPPDYYIDKTEEELNEIHKQHQKDQEKILSLIVEHIMYYHKYPDQVPKYPDDENVKDDDNINDDIDNITEWDKEFLGKLDKVTRAQLISVANYLNYKHLLKSCGKYIASLIRGKSVEEMRQILGIVNDFTEEEEERIKQENEWMKE